MGARPGPSVLRVVLLAVVAVFVPLVLAVTAAGLLAGPAWSQDSPPPTLSTATVAPGGTVGLSGPGCAGNQTVTVLFDGTALTSTTSTSTGGYSAQITVPDSTTQGSHTVIVQCNGALGPRSFTTTVTVSGASAAAHPSSAALPNSGFPTAPCIAVALWLLATGAACLWAADSLAPRRRPCPPPLAAA